MDNKATLVVALTQRGQLPPAVFELLTAARALADAAKEPVCAVAVGAKACGFSQELIERGADKVFTVDSPALDSFNDELHAKAVGDLAQKERFARVLLPSSVAGRSLAARLAVRLKAGLACDASELRLDGSKLKARRPQFSGNILAEVEFKSPVQVLTLQAMAYARADRQAGRSGELVKAPFEAGPSRVEQVSFTPEAGDEIDLGAAERVVSGGRGLGSADGFKLVYELARELGAAVGASRAVVDSGWIPYRHQVGLTGRSIRPKLYVAVGISGQIQHLAGMSASGTIVAINTDSSCPMMELASLAVAEDYAKILPPLIAELKKRRGAAA
ncbi:MAG: electron transfer flavoprotein subunit alpha/FixB family protein [Elusimicrobia bacterium]|nr:electron transfer flavoprotein subunit alpha/FixB family protein [Elusimicrobiota bacterium]MDE2236373.1 electron transfer flavoprotein subunit alpha/FixB family protein [Elusimicrobiota bacterium]MDE2424773.1 electron transfer flavoprotein subunit alpha/FixB family protein [Elusimicrobiota bacterium]